MTSTPVLTESTSASEPGRPGVPTVPDGHRWDRAGDAWGRRALDWACLFEHYAIDVIVAMFDRLELQPGSELLDVACGSGLAMRMADGLGASVAGIDAAESLIEIARARTPEGDIRVGDMFDLPWDDASFDAVTAVNGVWGGCEAALAEAFRVLRPGGRIGISFWGHGHLDLRPCFQAFAEHAPPEHVAGMKRTNGIARPGVAESMLESVGFEVVERGGRMSTLEWPDADTAWRAMASVGPAVPALERVGPDVLRPIVMERLDALRDAQGIYRFRNDHQFVIARRPS
ncbi:MAG: class I SAM-dependent methyltransferase [Ilumatobacter sp.]|nr:class I SAM-dependent methyltransferase [Ilumatobacter sp.]